VPARVIIGSRGAEKAQASAAALSERAGGTPVRGMANPEAGAADVVVQMATDIGITAWHAGPIDKAAVAEALTSVLIFMNKRYKFPGAGIKIAPWY